MILTVTVVAEQRANECEEADFRHTRNVDDSRRLLLAYHRTRDDLARERLVELHLPLVRTLARRYARCGERLDDLEQVGAIGLLEAIERFDPDRGSDLAAYAVPTITGEMRNHLRDRSAPVRVPRRLSELTRRMRPPRELLTARLRRQPTLSELAREVGMREEEVSEAIESDRARTPVSLWTEDEKRGLERATTVDDAFDASDDRLLLAAAFRTLAERERRILHLRYFGGLSQREIALELGLSQIQVSRLIRASLDRLRATLGGAAG
jgi:RNA polymerase sigma-B factor